LDEQAIIKEIEGENLQEMVYKIDGEPILTYAGVKEAARRVGG
jgi:hypothetical protein